MDGKETYYEDDLPFVTANKYSQVFSALADAYAEVWEHGEWIWLARRYAQFGTTWVA